MKNKIRIYNKQPSAVITNEVANKKRKDIIVTKYERKVTYTEDGNMLVQMIPTKVNITRKVNETAKLIKEQTAAEKLAELEKIFTK